MQLSHITLAVFVMALWGFNFVMIHLGLEDVSPFLFCSLRFFFASIPLIFFLKKPNIPFWLILTYGLVNYAMQYMLLFSGMQLGMPAGLASLLYQTQVFFTIAFACIVFKEKPTLWQILGIGTAFLGICVIAVNLGGNITTIGFLLTITAALTWASGNIISKKIVNVNIFSLVVWGNFVSWPPVFLATLLIEGPASIQHTIQHFSLIAGTSILYNAYISTLFCFSSWSWLLQRYHVSIVAPFTLSVPVFAMLSSYWISGEPLPSWKIFAALLIMSGLAINLFGSRFINYLRVTRESYGTSNK